MFEETLLESSPRRLPVLRWVHYLASTFAGTLVFVLGLDLLPAVLIVAAPHALAAAAGVLGAAAVLQTLMLCYVWADAHAQHVRVWPWLVATLLLSLPGFLVYLVYAAATSGDWKRAAIPLAYVAEALMVGVLVLVPLIYTQALPHALLITEVHILPPPGPPPAQGPAPRVRPVHHAALNAFEAPARIPEGVRRIVENLEPAVPTLTAGPGVPGGMPPMGPQEGAGILGSMGIGGPPLPQPPERHTAPKAPVHIGGDVIAAMGVYQPTPVYPQLAIAAHVQGTVVLEAIIGKNGRVQDLKVISGPALLVRAAMEAVKTWRYQPTLLNGEPVDVSTEISVHFTLGQ